MATLSADVLKRLGTEIFARASAPQDHAQCVAAHLVEANLAGHDSHGVLRIPQYVDLIDAGRLSPGATMRIVQEMPGAAVVDGGGGFGQVIARDAMSLAIRKARTGAIGAVAVHNCTHTGRIGTYTHLAAQQGLIGIVTVNSGGGGQGVAPFGGIRRRLATNPISIGAPSPLGAPLVLDFASSVAPEGKVRTYYQADKPVPPGWLINARGEPTTDPGDFYHDPVGALLPMGGDVGHKGFCLAVMIDILAGALAGGGCVSSEPTEGRDGMLAIALDIEQFTPAADFARRVEAMARHVKSCPTAPGVERIYLPGERETLERQRRLREGIVVEPKVWDLIQRICRRFEIDEHV